MIALLLTAALMGAPPVTADTLSAVVHGRVWSGHDGGPLAFAVIEVRFVGTEEEPHYAVADAEGRYRLERVPAGLLELRALAQDHAPLEVAARVASGDQVELDLALEIRPIGLPPLLAEVAVERSTTTMPTIQPPQRRGEREVRETELRALEASPGIVEFGLGEPRPPGMEPDPGSLLYVRGAASDLKLVLLDGAPVYAPFHLGGLFDAFQPDVLRSARLWVGGAPARFDGGLSYVLDLRTRHGATDRIRTAGAADLMGVRSQVEGPVGPATFLAGGRTVHGAVHEGLTGDPLPYGYSDGLVRLDLPLGPSGLSGTGFWNRETVSLEALDGMHEPAYWGNTAGSLRWEGPAGDGRLELIAATGDFATRLPMAGEQPRIAEGNSRRTRLQGLYSQRRGPVDVDAGLALEHLTVRLRSQPIPVPAGRLSSGTTVPNLDAPTTGAAAGEASGTVVGAFADFSWSPLEDLSLRGGLRTDAFLTDPTLRLAPRLGAAWQASESTILSVAVGRFHQYVRGPETVLGGDLEGWPVMDEGSTRLIEGGVVPSGSLLAVVGASHLVVGLENRLRDDVSLGLEAFLKTFDGIPAVEGLRASGADIWLHRAGDHWDAWLGYSIAWVWTERSEPERDRFAGRHLVSGGLGADLVRGLELSLELAYGSGLPFTPIPRSPQTSAAPLADVVGLSAAAESEQEQRPPLLAGAPAGSYMRLDAGISRSWFGRLSGMDFELTPYVKLLNALDRRDALFYHFDPERDLRPRSLAAVPLLPVLGVEWRI